MMIKLENVSICDLMLYAKHRRDKDKINVYEYIYELLKKHDIDNFQQLKELLESNDADLEVEGVVRILNSYLRNVIQRMNIANDTGRELEVFTFDNYENSTVDDETLRLTDRENNGGVLLYTIPYVICGAKRGQLRHSSIDFIKYQLMYVDDYYMKNIFSWRHSFGLNSTKRVAELINFYEQQVVRQAMETQERGVNLFTLNKKEKDEIVESEIKDIVEYIVDNAKECVWGSLSDTQKLRLMKSVLPSRSECALQDRMALVDAISNYTTLSELEQGIIKKKTLDRFIVR